MTNTTSRRKSATKSPKADVYQIVTDRIVEMLEAGTVPWRKPWTPGAAPRSIQGYEYRGINAFLLAAVTQAEGYKSPFWITFNQAKARGGSIRKGEKSTLVVFWKQLRVTEKNEAGQDETKTIPMLRYYNVFNIEQTEGVTLPKAVADWTPALVEHDPVEAAEAIIAGYENGPQWSETGDQAVYYPGLDVIRVPERGRYPNSDEFYTTLFHEFGHSTGHTSRLNRDFTGTFGDHAYGREELIAEMTAAFLSAEAGISSTQDNTAAYLASWVRTLREDPRAVVVAAGAAQRAADHILGRSFAKREETQDTATDRGEVALAA